MFKIVENNLNSFCDDNGGLSLAKPSSMKN